MWVGKQMGHVTVEMIIRTYGKWIPDSNVNAGYKPVTDWANHIQQKEINCPVGAPWVEKVQFFIEKNPLNQEDIMAEWTGLEPSM